MSKVILKKDDDSFILEFFDKLNRVSCIVKLDNLEIDELARDILLDPATRGDQK